MDRRIRMHALIAVTEQANGRKYRLNGSHIVGLSPRPDGGTTVFLSTSTQLVVRESVDDLSGDQ